MSPNLQEAADAVLQRVVTNGPRVPGVVAMVRDCRRNVYEGAAGGAVWIRTRR